MEARALAFRPERIRLGDDREIVLVRYVASGGRRGEARAMSIEGFVRPTPRRARPGARSLRYARRSMKELTHVDASGQARMVNIGEKQATERLAIAGGLITMQRETFQAILANQVAKGDVLGVARLAGIMAAKRTADLIPLCHQIALSDVGVDFEPDPALPGFRVRATARTTAQTGVEMEAILAASVSLITLYDMAKGLDKGMVLGEISLLEKRGGKSGHWVRG